jgi:hypothetical protein
LLTIAQRRIEDAHVVVGMRLLHRLLLSSFSNQRTGEVQIKKTPQAASLGPPPGAS